jgi:hypothetical protein
MPLPGQPPSPALAAAPANTGGAVAPQGNAGNAMAGLDKVKIAVKALQDALPSIPMGSALHTKVLNAAKDLSKELGSASEGGGGAGNIQALLQMIQQAKQNAPNAALARMAPPAPGGGAPAMPHPMPMPSPAAAAA